MFWGKSFDPDRDIPDLSGKVILVTGGTSRRTTQDSSTHIPQTDNPATGNTGLGKESVLQLSKHKPARIFLAARTPAKAHAAIADIRRAVPDAPVTFLELDLASLASVQRAAQSFLSQSARLDILLNNAGVMATPPATTADGYELQFGTNHVGHALLTKLLLPTLLATAAQPGADVRVVTLSSEGHNLAPTPAGVVLDQHELRQQSPWRRYGQSKLANILFTRQLARRHPAITAVAVHPGVIITGLYQPARDSGPLMRAGLAAFGLLSWPFLPDVPRGTLNQLWACCAARAEVQSGGYYTPVGRKSAGSAFARDEGLAEKLWEWTEGELERRGF